MNNYYTPLELKKLNIMSIKLKFQNNINNIFLWCEAVVSRSRW